MGLFGISFTCADWTRGGIETAGSGGYTRGSGGIESARFPQTPRVESSNNKYAKYEQYDLRSPNTQDADHGQNLYCIG